MQHVRWQLAHHARELQRTVACSLPFVPLVSSALEGLRAATQEAVKFMNHSKRSTLTTDDINAGLQLRNVEVRVAHGSRLRSPPPNPYAGKRHVLPLT